MLSDLHISEFTVFSDAKFQFSAGLNVIVGDNGTGKSHLLKLAYLFSRAWPDLQAKRLRVTKQSAETYFAERLAGLFRVPQLELLIRRGHKSSAQLRANISGHIPTISIRVADELSSLSPGLPEPLPWAVEIRHGTDASTALTAEFPDSAARNAFLLRQVFVPSKEMVSLFKGLIGLFDTYRDFPLDETFRDLAVAMSTLERREPSPLLVEVTKVIQKQLGGELKLENSDLVFVRDDGARVLSPLLAEGHRKLAMLVYLLRNGIVEPGSTLYWDEPETNLNPSGIKLLVQALHSLSGHGVQVILATHSLFLLREVEILQGNKKSAVTPPPRYFSLGLTRNKGVEVSQGDDIADINPLVMLDENLQQSDRYMESGL